MSAQHEQSLEGSGLGVRFRFAGDRYGHEIWLANGLSWVPVLSSVEGTAEQSWPPSPPLQSLHVESERGGRPVALLVGMAGQSHWSASIELDTSVPWLRFDLACRVGSGEAPRLGSCYRGLWLPAREEPRLALFVAAEQPDKGVRIQGDEFVGDTRLKRTREGTAIAPAADIDLGADRTIRWAYTITVGTVSSALEPKG